MKSKWFAAGAVLLSIAVCRASLAADDKTYSLGQAGTLHVKLPAGWTGESDGATPPTIALKSAQGKHVSIQITALPVDPADAKIKAAAQIIGDHYAEGSVEKKATVEELKGPNMHGYVCSCTDAAADPGEFKYVTAGMLACDKTALAVTLLYDQKTSADHTAALDAIKSFSVTAYPAATQPAAAVMHVKSPDGKWTLDLPGPWQIVDDAKSPDGKSRQVTAMADNGMMLTLFLEPAAKKGDAKAARDFYLARMKKNPIGMDNLKKDSVGDVAYSEYDQGIADFKEHNLNAYISFGGVWVDCHVSKSGFDEKKDRAVFDDILKGMKADAPPAPAKGH